MRLPVAGTSIHSPPVAHAILLLPSMALSNYAGGAVPSDLDPLLGGSMFVFFLALLGGLVLAVRAGPVARPVHAAPWCRPRVSQPVVVTTLHRFGRPLTPRPRASWPPIASGAYSSPELANL